MNKQEFLNSKVVKQGLVTIFEDDDGNVLLRSKLKGENFPLFDVAGKINKSILLTEIIYNTILKERKINEIYDIKYDCDEYCHSYISLVDPEFPELRYGIINFIETDGQKITKDDVNNYFDESQIILYQNKEKYKGNYFSVFIFSELEKILNTPKNIIKFMNKTEKERDDIGLKLINECGIYIEKRNSSLEEETPRLTTEKKGFVIPEIVRLREVRDENMLIKYYSQVSDASKIPTSSAYPESLKNIRDVIPFLDGDAKKKKLVESIAKTIFDGLSVKKDLQKEELNVVFDETVISTYGRIKELFTIHQKTTIISNNSNKPKIANFSSSDTVIVLSDSIALVDGQNSIDALAEISKMINAYLQELISKKFNNIYKENSSYKKIIKMINQKYSSLNIGIDQEIKEVKLILDAIKKHLVQIDLKIISNAYENTMDKIVEAKNLSISISGTDNKLFELQKIYPVIQNSLLDSKKLESLYLTYAKAQVPKFGEEDNSDNWIGIHLGEVISPYLSSIELNKKPNNIQIIRNTFKGKAFSKNDAEILAGLVVKYKDTPDYELEIKKMEESKKIAITNAVAEESFNKENNPDYDMTLEIDKITSAFENRKKKLQNKEYIINKSSFRNFESFLLDYSKTREIFKQDVRKMLNIIQFGIKDKALFEMFLATCFYKNRFGDTTVDPLKWAVSLNKAIYENGGNLTTIRNNQITDDSFFKELLNLLSL